MIDFIPVEKATTLVLENTQDFGIETIAFEAAIGRVLAENITADRDFPPFDRVTMDGIAIQGESYKKGQRAFRVESIQFAGEAQKSLIDPKACIEVMTGASMPKNSDSDIRYEDLKLENGTAVLADNLVVFRNVHKKGTDRKKEAILLQAGKQLRSSDIAVLATVGKTEICVKKLPKIAIVTSGDELVEVVKTPLAHQIRKSNIFAISSLLKPFTSDLKHFHLKDNLAESISLLTELFKTYDAVVLSGGVSAGKKDFLPEALKIIGLEKRFHKIQQRPGKPMWFGTIGKTLAFALPGNPVSSFMCAVRYVLPWLQTAIGIKPKEEYAVLTENVNFKPNLSYFMQVSLSQEKGTQKATPLEGGGSGDLANLSLAEAFLELPSRPESEYLKGELFRIWRF